MEFAQILLLFLLGLGVGTYGTLIGAGGGFILVPALLIIYPDLTPTSITSLSLCVVFFNALSGSVAYARLRRIDYRTGILFALATLPGAVLGVFIVDRIPRNLFQLGFGTILIILALFIIFRPAAEDRPVEQQSGDVLRTLTDCVGQNYTWRYNRSAGIGISIVVGFLSSILGIGGGIIHVPAMNYVLNFPAYVATATSQFILSFSSLSGALTHLVQGNLTTVSTLIAPLAGGVIIGAQLGAQLSRHLRGRLIIQMLATALALAGIRLVIGNR